MIDHLTCPLSGQASTDFLLSPSSHCLPLRGSVRPIEIRVNQIRKEIIHNERSPHGHA